jgi:hypothetical protein
MEIPEKYKDYHISFTTTASGICCIAMKQYGKYYGFCAWESSTKEDAWLAMKDYFDTSSFA